MIKCDYLSTRSDGVILVKTYSTDNKYIKQVETGLEYDEAVDIGVYQNGYKPLKYTYVETDKEIQVKEEIPVEVEEEL
ncbi:MAG: hypothetical protein SOW55_07290 [Bacilli bacterium]|nr:hypothetical protein [Bacilli bacterium]